jgi:hypothetical protein
MMNLLTVILLKEHHKPKLLELNIEALGKLIKRFRFHTVMSLVITISKIT